VIIAVMVLVVIIVIIVMIRRRSTASMGADTPTADASVAAPVSPSSA
jgi:hypothetical protein